MAWRWRELLWDFTYLCWNLTNNVSCQKTSFESPFGTPADGVTASLLHPSLPSPLCNPTIVLPIFSRSSAVGSHSIGAHGLSHFSKCASRRLSISFLMSLMSVNRSQRVTSQLLRSPSNSTINSSTSPRWSRYFSRRCCLQMSAVCFCRFLVPNPILCAEFLYRILYRLK